MIICIKQISHLRSFKTDLSLLFIFWLASSSVVNATTAGDFPPGPEHDLVVKTCTKCHVAAQVTAQHKTADQWADTVTQMISNGAQVTDADFDKIVNYLAQNFGPAGPLPDAK